MGKIQAEFQALTAEVESKIQAEFKAFTGEVDKVVHEMTEEIDGAHKDTEGNDNGN